MRFKRIGCYNVTAKIGEGGMGEVYRARDTKLDRDVALKVLPQAFTDDPDRLARFEREAKVLASLNHPNIAAIHGLEESDGIRALVLELVEGPTLADRIKQGPISIDEALPIAKQIAAALEAAHEAGVIHRDLKPANVVVKDDGTVKVLDFGLAKAFQPDASDPGLSQSPTISLTAAATQMGMVIGTAAYMAPEQASGKAVDKRADVWAFGVVLFEMLTGTRPFVGDEMSKTLAHVIATDPDWSTLPQDLPPVVSSFLRGCLEKEPRERVRDIGDVRLAMKGTFETGVAAVSEPIASPTLPIWQRPIAIGAIALTTLALGGLTVWTVMRPEPRDLISFAIVPPDAATLRFERQRQDLVISRDGTQIIYHANHGNVLAGGSQLALRPINQLAAVSLRGTEGAFAPFVSPNGQWVGFQSSSSALQKVSIYGGPPVPVCQSEGDIVGASCGMDDDIIFGTDDAGLFRVSGSGGDAEVLTTLDSEQGEARHTWPFIIPGRRAVLFVVSTGSVLTTGQLAVLDLESGDVTRLGLAGVSPRYVSTGHLVYATEDGSVRAVPFDATSLEVTGNPVPLLESVSVKGTGAANFDISDAGRLVYVLGGGQAELRSLVWVGRDGREEVTGLPPLRYAYPRISPDGERVAVPGRADDGDAAIWIWDFEQQTRTRLIVSGDAGSPVWTSNGDRLAYESDGSFYEKAANNTGTPDLLVEDPRREGAAEPTLYFFSPDGGVVFRDQETRETDDDLVMISLDGEAERVWSLTGNFRESNAELSPSSPWLKDLKGSTRSIPRTTLWHGHESTQRSGTDAWVVDCHE